MSKKIIIEIITPYCCLEEKLKLFAEIWPSFYIYKFFCYICFTPTCVAVLRKKAKLCRTWVMVASERIHEIGLLMNTDLRLPFRFSKMVTRCIIQ